MKKRSIVAIAATVLLGWSGLSRAQDVARVGERVITMQELKQAVSSTPYGDPQTVFNPEDRSSQLFKILVEMIDSELLYREAMETGITQTARYKDAVDEYGDAVLADLYEKRLYEKEIDLPQSRVDAYAAENNLTPEAARALLKKDKKLEVQAREGARLYDKYHVSFTQEVVKKAVEEMADDDLLVKADFFTIRYRDIKEGFRRFGGTNEALVDYLSQGVEERLFAREAKAAGLNKEGEYKAFMDEYAHSMAINLHREALLQKLAPAEKDVQAYIDDNEWLHYYPRQAAVVMVVVESEEKARQLRQRALEGDSIHRIAMENSIAPKAEITAGNVGPIKIGGRPYTQLDKVLLDLKPGEISQPIKGDKGYSIFKLVEISPNELRPPSAVKQTARQKITEERLYKHLEGLRDKGEVVIYGLKGVTNL